MPSIPASAIVDVNPNVLSAGGQALDLIGLVLTTSTRIPIGSVLSFASKEDVSNYFGPSSNEALGAPIYFGGFDDSRVKPAAILFSQYPTAPVAAFLRGGSLASMTLTQLKALSGTISLTVNGAVATSATINLSAATSFSNAATLIQAAFASPAFTVTFDSIASAFLFTGNTTGPSSTITFATGTLSPSLLLLQSTGAVISQGSAATDPTTAMNAITTQTTNWATFFTAFNPDSSGNANKLLFALWAAQSNNRYAYICWDTDTTPQGINPATNSLGYLLQQGNYGGTALVWQATDEFKEWFISGAIASIDFTQQNGNTDLAFKSQSGLTPSVTNETIAANLLANGYNFYGAYATANDQFIWLYNGQISGDYKTIRAYVNQIWLSNGLQLAGMTLFANTLAIPYNAFGRTLIEAAMLDPINAAVNFGAIQAGVTLSAAQIAEVNAAAGAKIDTILQNRGWYLQVLDASPIVRQAGGSPPINFWYTDGGSVRKLVISSTDVQ